MGTRTPLKLSEVERAELERVARRPSTPQALAKRCRVILLDDRGDMTYAQIGEELSMREQTVLKWRSRFLKHRMAGLRDAPRPGVKKRITKEMIAEVVRKTLEDKPKGATHWSLRSMAAASGISRSSNACSVCQQVRVCGCTETSDHHHHTTDGGRKPDPAEWSHSAARH